jgi:hypothetical protein
MNNIGKPPEPNREVVERAIAEVLGIAQRQGITPADFVRMLDSGMRMSDFLTAMDRLQTPTAPSVAIVLSSATVQPSSPSLSAVARDPGDEKYQ